MILPFFFPSSNTNAGTQEKLIACPLLTSLPLSLPPVRHPLPTAVSVSQICDQSVKNRV